MVSSIGSTSLAQSLLARVESRTAQAAQDTAAAASVTPADDADSGTASAQSAQSAAAARVGGQLDAQFDAAIA
ncbi:hypothetical protein [Massilia sp. Mn16-1_5]|uniref:hypothetical protein n=1 Tax=Massilia sp. Mn16-1_5 TaxID=2079199 RepID=UPI0014454725|nr:hypothetical protein [Massilia sp. Mn16-1_5]